MLKPKGNSERREHERESEQREQERRAGSRSRSVRSRSREQEQEREEQVTNVLNNGVSHARAMLQKVTTHRLPAIYAGVQAQFGSLCFAKMKQH